MTQREWTVVCWIMATPWLLLYAAILTVRWMATLLWVLLGAIEGLAP